MRAQWYERLGIRFLYRFVAGVVMERMLPSTSETNCDWGQDEIEEAERNSRYFGAANFARASCYIPQAIAFYLFRYWPGLNYVLILFILHGHLVALEGYKRRLCKYWIPKISEDNSPRAEPDPSLPKGWFEIKKFESERFYRILGLELFKRFVTMIMSKLTYGFSGKRMIYIPQPNRSNTVAFERATRVSEIVHWSSAVSVLPLVFFSWHGAPLGIAIWSTIIVWGDIMLALLQRYHRSRLWVVLKRIVSRKK